MASGAGGLPTAAEVFARQAAVLQELRARCRVLQAERDKAVEDKEAVVQRMLELRQQHQEAGLELRQYQQAGELSASSTRLRPLAGDVARSRDAAEFVAVSALQSQQVELQGNVDEAEESYVRRTASAYRKMETEATRDGDGAVEAKLETGDRRGV